MEQLEYVWRHCQIAGITAKFNILSSFCKLWGLALNGDK